MLFVLTNKKKKNQLLQFSFSNFSYSFLNSRACWFFIEHSVGFSNVFKENVLHPFIGPCLAPKANILWITAVKALLSKLWSERNQRMFPNKHFFFGLINLNQFVWKPHLVVVLIQSLSMDSLYMIFVSLECLYTFFITLIPFTVLL